MIRIAEGPTKIWLTGDRREIRAVAQKLRFHPTGYWHSPRYQAYQLTDGAEGWDGFLSPIRFTNEDEEQPEAECLRGHRDKVIRAARELEFNVDTKECLRSPFHALTTADIPDDLIAADFQLDEHQRQGIAYWLKHGMGVNKIAVNGGKTAMFAATAQMIKRRMGDDSRVLYVTQSERLVRQAYKDMRQFLPGWSITQYGGSRKDNTGTDLVVSTVAMLWKNHHKLMDTRWLESFVAVLYDESHHASSATSTKLLMLLPAYFRLGASDTKKEKNPTDRNKIEGLLGPIRFTVAVGTYIDAGRSARPTIYIVENHAWNNKFAGYPQRAEPGTPAWALVGDDWKRGTYVGPVYERDENGEIKMRTRNELEDEVDEAEIFDGEGNSETIKTARWSKVEVPVTVDGYHVLQFEGDPEQYEVESTYCLLHRVQDRALVRFKERNELIAAWTAYYSVKRNFPTLVVCTRTIHSYILESLITKQVNPEKVRVLLGDHTSRERDETFNWFRKTPGSVLISPLVQEGVSINELRAGVIADYVGDWERANQIIGRFIRKKQADNEAHITWFYDNQHETLRRGSKRVLHKLIDIRGYTFAYPLIGPDTIKDATVYKSLA